MAPPRKGEHRLVAHPVARRTEGQIAEQEARYQVACHASLAGPDVGRDVFRLRAAGATWLTIAQAFDLTLFGGEDAVAARVVGQGRVTR